MAYRFFAIPVRGAEAAGLELNGFLRSHRVLAVDRRWVDQGESSYWAFCVDYLETSGGPALASKDGQGLSRAKVDYREVLSKEDFDVFARLRELRKQIAQAEAVPVYTIFTNDQLAQMVRARATTKAALEQIAGVGDARMRSTARGSWISSNVSGTGAARVPRVGLQCDRIVTLLPGGFVTQYDGLSPTGG